MSEVIVITSGKGGVGKTTTTANLGICLAKLGKKVVLVDTDIGLRNLDILLGLENSIVYDLVDLVSGVCTTQQALINHPHIDGLSFIPAAQTKDKDTISAEDMQIVCEKLKKDFDFIIIDCPAGIEQGFKNAIAAADKALIVVNPEFSSTRDADRIVGLLEENEIFDYYLIINKIRPDMVKRGEMMNVEDIIGILEINLMGIVPDDINIIISANKKEYEILSSKSLAGQAYQNIAQRLNGNMVPLLNLDESAFKRILKKIFSKNTKNLISGGEK